MTMDDLFAAALRIVEDLATRIRSGTMSEAELRAIVNLARNQGTGVAL
jgi:hypothetical protein